jgi:hypothetical protein
MFGNKLGWGISAVLAVALLMLARWLTALAQISPPSRGVVVPSANISLNLPDRPELLEPIKLPFNPNEIYPGMNQSKDAGPLYRQAIDVYLRDRARYDGLFERNTPATTDLKALPAIALLVEARTCDSMNLYASRPEEVVTYNYSPPGVAALYQVGKLAAQLSRHLAAGNTQRDDALALAEAAFSLGVKLCDERLRWAQFDAGQNLLREGAQLIGKLDTSRAAQTGGVDKAMFSLMKERLLPVWWVLSSPDQNIIGRTGGDVFYIARNSKERMWRIEGVLKMGWYKYNVGEPGHGPNQKWAAIVARRMAEDQSLDPAVRTAAAAARDLTADGYQLMTSNIGR